MCSLTDGNFPGPEAAKQPQSIILLMCRGSLQNVSFKAKMTNLDIYITLVQLSSDSSHIVFLPREHWLPTASYCPAMHIIYGHCVCFLHSGKMLGLIIKPIIIEIELKLLSNVLTSISGELKYTLM